MQELCLGDKGPNNTELKPDKTEKLTQENSGSFRQTPTQENSGSFRTPTQENSGSFRQTPTQENSGGFWQSIKSIITEPSKQLNQLLDE